MIPDLFRNRGRVAWIAVDIVHDLRLPVRSHPAANALLRSDRQPPDGLGVTADGAAKAQVAGLLVGEQDRACLRVDRVHRAGEHALEHVVQARRGR